MGLFDGRLPTFPPIPSLSDLPPATQRDLADMQARAALAQAQANIFQQRTPMPGALQSYVQQVLPPIYEQTVKECQPGPNKAHNALERLSAELPYKVAFRIKSAKFTQTYSTVEKRVVGYRFVVEFDNGHKIEFDAEGFPSDADIARICLECP